MLYLPWKHAKRVSSYDKGLLSNGNDYTHAGHNPELMEKCEALHGYSVLIDKIRCNQNSGMSLEEAIEKATDAASIHNAMDPLESGSMVYVAVTTNTDDLRLRSGGKGKAYMYQEVCILKSYRKNMVWEKQSK